MNRYLVRFLVPGSGVVKASVPVEALSLHDAVTTAVFAVYGGSCVDLDLDPATSAVVTGTIRLYSRPLARTLRAPSLELSIRAEALSAYACAKGFADFVLQAIPNP